MTHKIVALILVIAIAVTACSPQQAPTQSALSATSQAALEDASQMTKIRLPMGYIPNVQFAPFYVAIENGYFADQNIEIEMDYSFELNGVAMVGADELPFTISSGEQVLLAREQGLPVVYVFATYQNYPISIIAKTGANIHTPSDLRGKRIGVPSLLGPTLVGLQAVLFSGGLTASDVTVDTIGFNQVEALVADRELVVVGYANNEPIQLRSQGYDITELRVADYAQLAGDGIVTNEKTIAENPDLIRRFTRALAQGLEYTIAHPDEAYDICLKYVDNLNNADRTVQMEVLTTSIDFWRADRIGLSNADSWTNMNDVLVKMGSLKAPQDASAAFTNEFVP